MGPCANVSDSPESLQTAFVGLFSHLLLPNPPPPPPTSLPGLIQVSAWPLQISLEKEICSEVGGVRRGAQRGRSQILLPLYFRVLFLYYPPLSSHLPVSFLFEMS